MGRTARRRKCKNTQNRPSTGYQFEMVSLVAWMKTEGWRPTCRLTPARFKSTGRGLMAAENISSGQTLAVVPGSLIMTVDLVSKSPLGSHFTGTYKTQQVLATYLMFERHQGSQSFWHPYIISLPTVLSNAAYCTIENLPSDLIENVLDHQNIISTTFNQVMTEMSSHVCPHCSNNFDVIFEYEVYNWAWSIVNSRAVYISPDCSSSNRIKLSDINNLALAPFIDMFNHNPTASVEATVNNVNGAYTITTRVPFPKYSEVFINYGPHSNTKLFLEYGFIVPSNPQHTINLSVNEIFSITSKTLNEIQMRKLRSYGLLEGHFCSTSGLSWSTKILIYMSLNLNRLTDVELQYRVFANNFEENEMKDVKRIETLIIKTKLEEIKQFELNMLNVLETNEALKSTGFAVALELVKENRKILEYCVQQLNLT